jgi:multiple sugar transport system substrate-binding protein
MYAMPLSLGFPIMYYNKDIFDKFAVPYPKDGMSWEDVIELAKRVTRQSDGIQYMGFDGGGFARLSLSMLQEKYDAKREKALLTTPGWVRVLDYYKQWRSIPGNNVTGNMNLFAKEKRLAMFATFNGALSQLEDLYRQGDPLNWDMVTQPTFKEQPYVVDTPLQILMMAATSKHPDDVFRVMEVVTSKENQLHMSQNARPPVLKDIEVQNVFGQNYGSLKGKNVAAPFKYKHMPINVAANYDAIVNKHINNAAAQVLKGVDINTALREAEEAANKEIAGQAQ